MKAKDIKLLFHNDQAIMLKENKELPNRYFIKRWDDVKKDVYIIVENKKYYLDDLLKNMS